MLSGSAAPVCSLLLSLVRATTATALLLLLGVSSAVVSAHGADSLEVGVSGAQVSISLLHPVMGDTIVIPSGKESTELQATFDMQGAVIGQDGIFLHVEADGDQVVSNFLTPMTYVQLVKLEPGTHTIAMQIRRAGLNPNSEEQYDSESLLVAESRVVFDVVLPSVPLFFPPAEFDRFLGLERPRPYVGPEGFVEPIRIGVIASLKMDGQKTIWLEQFKHFPRSEYEFRFISYTANQANDGKMQALLDELNVPARLVDGLSISLELADVPDFPLNLVRLIRANTDIRRWATDLRPVELRFMHDFFEAFVVPLFGLDLVTFANARTEIDTLIVEAARLAGARRIVMELPNLYPPQHVHVDALVAPSHFVKNHPSVVADPTPCFVINPGIHLDSFLPHSMLDQPRVCHAANGSQAQPESCQGGNPVDRPFRIGFVARLAPEKNPGMFLRMAAELSARLARRGELRFGGDDAMGNLRKRKVEFIVIGDGEIRRELEVFTRWLFARLSQSQVDILSELEGPDPLVKFIGWVKRDELPQVLSTVDVLVNPSLRDSETFCIANLEAMAAGAALVTFANGGQSECVLVLCTSLVLCPNRTAMHPPLMESHN